MHHSCSMNSCHEPDVMVWLWKGQPIVNEHCNYFTFCDLHFSSNWLVFCFVFQAFLSPRYPGPRGLVRIPGHMDFNVSKCLSNLGTFLQYLSIHNQSINQNLYSAPSGSLPSGALKICMFSCIYFMVVYVINYLSCTSSNRCIKTLILCIGRCT